MKAVVRKTARVQHRSAPRGNERRLVTQHPRRRVLSLAAGAAALPAVSRVAWAQAYPSRPVRVIVPFAAGGGSDILARLIEQWLAERLGRPFIIENRPGSAGNIGTAVAHAPPDGYMLMRSTRPFTTTSISISSATSRLSRASCACPFSWWYIHRFRLGQFQS